MAFKVGNRVQSKQPGFEYTGTIVSIDGDVATIKRDDNIVDKSEVWKVRRFGLNKLATAYGCWDGKSFLKMIPETDSVSPFFTFDVGSTFTWSSGLDTLTEPLSSWYQLGSEPNYFATLKQKTMEKIKQIPNTLKRFLNGSFKAFYQLGWVDQDLDLTREGLNELTKFLFKTYEKEFGEYAAKKVAELKKEEADETDE